VTGSESGVPKAVGSVVVLAVAKVFVMAAALAAD
jgi:hypothetical protein